MSAHERLPQPLGHLAELQAREQHPIVRLERIRVSFEASLKMLTAVALSCALQANLGERSSSRLFLDARRFFNDAPTLGFWDAMLRRALRSISETPDALVDPQVYLTAYREFGRSPAASPLFASNGGSWDALLKFRNDLAHGAPGTSDRARALRSEIEPHITAVLVAMSHLRMGIVQLGNPASGSAQWVVRDADGNARKVELRNRLAIPLRRGSLAAIDPDCSWGVPLWPVMEVSASGAVLFFNDQKKAGRVVYLDYASGEKEVRYDEDAGVRSLAALFSAPGRMQEMGDVFAALVASKTKHFVGREDALRWLDGEPHARVSMVTGSPGIGKTSLLAKWTEDRDVVRHFFRANDMISVSPRNVLRSLVRQAERLTGVRASERDTDDPLELLVSWRRVLASADEPLTVVLDGLDEALTSDERLLDVLPDPDVVAPNVRFIVSGRPEVLEHHRVGPTVNRSLQLTALTLDETRALLTTAFNTYELLRDDGLVERVYERSQGHPLYLQLLVEDALESRITLSDLDRVPRGLPAFYRRIIERLEPAYEDMPGSDLAVFLKESGITTERIEELLTERNRNRAALDALALVALLREPVGAHDLAVMLGSSLDGIKRVLRRARSVLAEDATGRVSLFHESFREYVNGESAAIPTLREAFERATQCLQAYCTATDAIDNAYALQYWHWHLLDASMGRRHWEHVSKQAALQELSRLAHERAWLAAQAEVGVHLPAETATAWLNAATTMGDAAAAFEAGALLVQVSRQKRSIRPALMSASFDELRSAIQAFDPISHPALQLGWVLCRPNERQRHRAVLSLLEHNGRQPSVAPKAGSELTTRRYSLPSLLKLQYRILQVLAAEEESLKALLPDLASALGGDSAIGLAAHSSPSTLLSRLRDRKTQVDTRDLLAWLQASADGLSNRQVKEILLEALTRLRSDLATQWGIEWLANHEGHTEAVRVLESLPQHAAAVNALSLLAKGTLPSLTEPELERAVERGIGDLLRRNEVPTLLTQLPPDARTIIERALREHERSALGAPPGQRQRSHETTERLYLARAWLAMGNPTAAIRTVEEIAGPIPTNVVDVARDLIASLAPSHTHAAAQLAAHARGPRDLARVTSRAVGLFRHPEARLARGYKRIEAAILESTARRSLDAKALTNLLAVLEDRPDIGLAFPMEQFLQSVPNTDEHRSLLQDVFMAWATAEARASLMQALGTTEPVRNVEFGASIRAKVSPHSMLGLLPAFRPVVRPVTVGEMISRVKIVAAAVQGRHEEVTAELANLAAYATDDALDVLVSALASRGDYVAARQYAAEITDADVRDMTTLFIIGRLADTGKADDALSLCGQLTAGEAKCEGYLAVATGLIEAGDVRRAVDTMILATQSLLEAPHTEAMGTLRRESVLALARLGHLIPGERLQALKIAHNAPARVELALASYRSGHIDTAITELEVLARRWTSNGPLGREDGIDLAKALVEVGLGSAALEVAQSVQRKSTSNTVWFKLAAHAASQSLRELALEALSRGFSSEPGTNKSQDEDGVLSDEVVAIAEVLAKLGYSREAMELLEQNTIDQPGQGVHPHDALALRRVLDAIDAELRPTHANDATTDRDTPRSERTCTEPTQYEVPPNAPEPDFAHLIDPELARYVFDLNSKTGLLVAVQELCDEQAVDQAAWHLFHTAEYLVAAERLAGDMYDEIESTYCLVALAKVAIRTGLAEVAVRVANTETEISDDWDVRNELFDFAVQHARYRVAEALAADDDDRLRIATAQVLKGHRSVEEALERKRSLEDPTSELHPTTSTAAFMFAVGGHEDAFSATRTLGYPNAALTRLADVVLQLTSAERSPRAAIALTEFCAELPFLLPHALPILIPFCCEDIDRVLNSLSDA